MLAECRECNWEGTPRDGRCGNCGEPLAPPGQAGPAEPPELPENADPGLVVAGFVELLALAASGLDPQAAAAVGERAKRSLLALTGGYDEDPAEALRAPLGGGGRAVLSGAPFRSVCSGCLLPFEGTATVAAVVDDGHPAVGCDHLRRLLRCLSRRLHTEDSLAEQLAAAVCDLGGAKGGGAIVRARRWCEECGGGEAVARAGRGELDPQALGTLDRAEAG